MLIFCERIDRDDDVYTFAATVAPPPNEAPLGALPVLYQVSGPWSSGDGDEETVTVSREDFLALMAMTRPGK